MDESQELELIYWDSNSTCWRDQYGNRGKHISLKNYLKQTKWTFNIFHLDKEGNMKPLEADWFEIKKRSARRDGKRT